MTDILILGGSGFVSEALAKHLIKRGYNIDILTRGKKSINYDGYNEHIICDRRNIDQLKKVLQDKKYSYIFDISGYNKEDVEILFNCISAPSLKRYIFCSSAAVYDLTDELISEDAKLTSGETWGDYGRHKLEAEKYIFSLINNKNLRATIFRPTYIYGEGNTLYREGYFFDRISQDKVIPIPNDNVKVQFIHIEDVVKNFECAMYNDNDCRAYNLTSPYRFTWKEVIETCGNILNKNPKTKNISNTSYDVRSYFPFRSINFNLDITNLRENGFHSPMIYLSEGLETSYKWYKSEKPSLCDNSMTLVDNVLK